MEMLGLSAMARSGLGASVADAGLGEVLPQVAYKAEWACKSVIAATSAIVVAPALSAYPVVRGMLTPIRVRALRLGAVIARPAARIPDDVVLTQGCEFRAAFTRYNAMVNAAGDWEAQTACLA